MSSMFKKKGGLAFKPKAPVARPRPAASSAKPIPKPAVEAISDDAPEDPTTSVEDQEQVQSQDLRPPPQETATGHESSKEPERDTPATPRRSTRRASQSQHTERPPGPITHTPVQKDLASVPEIEPQTTPISKPRTRRQSAAAKAHSNPPVEQIPEEATLSTENRDIPADLDPPQPSSQPSAVQSSQEAVAATQPAPKRTRRKPSSISTAPPTDNAEDEAPSRPNKRQRGAATQQPDGASQKPAVRKCKAPTPITSRSRSGSRRVRSPTPSDAEDRVVDLQKLKMSDLTKDLRIGKKFSRHDELRERERKSRLKAKLEKGATILTPTSPDGPSSLPSSTKVDAAQSPPNPTPPTTSGPQFRIVDGQIVVDQNSLVMDRHARAAAAQADMETIEENDFTRLITSSSFMTTSKLKGPNIWTGPETDLFYRALRMFGTDFQMIAGMFPSKQRRHIKLKFNREERHNPSLVSAAVTGEKTIKMDIDEYRALTGAEFETVESIEAEQRKIQEGYEAERQRLADEQAEIMRKKREELFADDQDDENATRKKKKKGSRKKGKQAVAYGLNGEPVAAAD